MPIDGTAYLKASDGTLVPLSRVGPQGPKGDPGDPGAQGPAGPAGPLDILTDVTAPASTPAGKVLGTTATGQWGPVDPPAGGGGGPSPATTNPVSVSVASSLVGTSLDYARADHKHTIQVANPVALGAAAAGGTSSALARADHVHPVPALDALPDVDAPADTPAGKVLGTTATGQWGPVDPPAGGGGGPEQWWADQVQGLLTATTGWADPYPQYDAATDYARNAVVGRAGMYYYASADPTVGVAPPAAPWVPLNLLRIVQSKGLANGYAGLDSHGKVPDSELAHPIWTGTQAAYDALAVKDPATIYMITG